MVTALLHPIDAGWIWEPAAYGPQPAPHHVIVRHPHLILLSSHGLQASLLVSLKDRALLQASLSVRLGHIYGHGLA